MAWMSLNAPTILIDVPLMYSACVLVSSCSTLNHARSIEDCDITCWKQCVNSAVVISRPGASGTGAILRAVWRLATGEAPEGAERVAGPGVLPPAAPDPKEAGTVVGAPATLTGQYAIVSIRFFLVSFPTGDRLGKQNDSNQSAPNTNR